MIIKTNFGTFVSFRDVRTYMVQEDVRTVDIFSVDYWGAAVLAKGTYTLGQIDFVLFDPDCAASSPVPDASAELPEQESGSASGCGGDAPLSVADITCDVDFFVVMQLLEDVLSDMYVADESFVLDKGYLLAKAYLGALYSYLAVHHRFSC